MVGAGRLAAGFGVGLLLAAGLGAVLRVAAVEALEVQVVERTTIAERMTEDRSRARLLSAALRETQLASFELCSEERLTAGRWRDAISVEVAVRASDAAADEVALAYPLDEAALGHVRRNATSGCLEVAEATIDVAGRYSVDVRWEGDPPPALLDVPLSLRVLARPRLTGVDQALVALLWLGSLALAVALGLGGRGRAPRGQAPLRASAPGGPAQSERRLGSRPSLDPSGDLDAMAPRIGGPAVRLALAVGAVLGAYYATGWLPPGAAAGLAAGMGLALAEGTVALAMIDGRTLRAKAEALALRPPSGLLGRPLVAFVVAAMVGLGLVYVAGVATRFVPSTGTSPVQALIAWPSGRLAFMALAMVAPLGEELFFRGFVFGTVERWSRTAAFLAAWLLFALAHARQDFHQWGALIAVLVTGLALTGLRAASRSTLPPTVAHLVYNGILAMAAL
ncbi:MAG: lysostaphin resistance A-like protein [Sandaracinaceae bacterium]